MRESDQSDNVYALPKFNSFAENEDLELHFYPNSFEQQSTEKINDFVCRSCQCDQGYSQIKVVLDVVLGGVTKTALAGYCCDNCSTVFADPQKFSRTPEKDQA